MLLYKLYNVIKVKIHNRLKKINKTKVFCERKRAARRYAGVGAEVSVRPHDCRRRWIHIALAKLFAKKFVVGATNVVWRIEVPLKVCRF